MRFDKFGNKINSETKKYFISFKDKLIDVKYVDNWKEYNVIDEEI